MWDQESTFGIALREGPHDEAREIARVLLEAGRHDEADALWRELWAADPEEQWTLNAGGLSYHETDRDEEAVKWLGEGLRLALADDDPLQIVDQMSDARRLSLKRLGREPDSLEHEVETFRARKDIGGTIRVEADRALDRRLGVPSRSTLSLSSESATLPAVTLTAKVVSGNEVRIPDPHAGEVTVISRYGKERAMLVHPDDFHRLDELDRMLAEAAELPSLEPTHQALRAHLEESTPGEPITDPAALAELFG